MKFMDDLLRRAEELGLTVSGRAAHGTYDGSRVSLGFELVGNQSWTAVARGWVDPPFDLGLDVHRRVVATLSEPEPVSGNPDLDGEFVLEGDEPSRVRHLFDAPLCARLVATHRASMEFRLHDTGCAVFGLYGLFDVDVRWLDRALDAAAETARLMSQARHRVPPATRLEPYAMALEAYAAARGLGFTSTPLLVSGDVEGRALEIGSIRTSHGRYHLRARAALDGDLGIGLQVRRQGILDDLALVFVFGSQDIIVGDAPFDKRFLIHAQPARAARVATLLDADIRATLLAIDARAGAVALDDGGVTVDPIHVGHAPEMLAWLLDGLVEVSGQISKNLVHGGGTEGPYR